MPISDEGDIRELMRAIGRLEGKIDGMLTHYTVLHGDHKELKVNHSHLISRVGKLEGRINLYAGGVAVLLPILVFLSEPLAKLLFGGS